MSASQEQTLSGRGVRVYTAHMGWMGMVMGISSASTGRSSTVKLCYNGLGYNGYSVNIDFLVMA